MSAPAVPPFLRRILPGKGLRWASNSGRNILQPERRDEAVSAALQVRVGRPNRRMTSRPAKREVERLLVDIVDTCTRLVRENPAMMNPMDFMAGVGMTGVGNDDFNIWDFRGRLIPRPGSRGHRAWGAPQPSHFPSPLSGHHRGPPAVPHLRCRAPARTQPFPLLSSGGCSRQISGGCCVLGCRQRPDPAPHRGA
ncbi:hypothetical protein B0H65DRAFT_476722 [Neurospora tetraspora]|uniref:Uncharacterized protein n=1 Tax=Neurospora tetraspora TaxID=94610 RepID=A0AAE0JA64_9PEZI|nr:hypothetical protein B0H65DRAFT_476722 [Neurospora tetraspora]